MVLEENDEHLYTAPAGSLSVVCRFVGGFAANTLMPKTVFAAFGPQVRVTTMQVPNVGVNNVSTTYTKIWDIGSFTVQDSASLVEVTHQGRLYITNVVGANGVYFELRVDDQPPIPDSGLMMVRSAEATTYVPNTASGYWEGLSPGEHTVSLWVRTPGGSASPTMNPGGWASNDVIVKEYLPFGTTALPLISR